MEEKRVRCMFTGNRRYDASARQTPDRLMTRYNGSSLLIDCGEGTQVAIKEKGWTFKPIDAICFTHYHADHISGLPGLLLTMGNTDRREPLTMIGPKGLERVVNSLRVICPELPFPIVFHEVTAPEEVIEMNGYKITAFRVQHNITCYGYSLEISRKENSMWSALKHRKFRLNAGIRCRKARLSPWMERRIRRTWSSALPERD